MILGVEWSLSELNGNAVHGVTSVCCPLPGPAYRGQEYAPRIRRPVEDCNSALGPLDEGHHLGRVTFADDFDLRDASFDVFKVVFAQGDFERPHVLFEVTNALRAWNGHEIFSLG